MRKPALHRVLLIIGLFTITSRHLTAGIQAEAEAVIQSVFNKEHHIIQFDPLALSPAERHQAETKTGQRFILDQIYLWIIYDSTALAGIAVLDNVRGKAQPITYLVVYTPDLVVKQVHIIKYREQIGGAVQNQRWLGQFSGYRDQANETLSLGGAIDGITGATISADAIIRGVARMTAYLNALNFNEIIHRAEK